MREVTINENDAGQRLDKFLSKYMRRLPQGLLYKGLRKNCARVNGRHIKDGKYMLRAGDVLTLYFADEFFEDNYRFVSGGSDINIVYEDGNILIIDKEAGIPVHPDDKGTADTLLKRMQSYLYEKGEYNPEREHSFSPAFANRLDRNTSGLVIGAKNAAALRALNEKIKNREIKKYYLAVCEGVLEGSGFLSAYLTRGEKKVSVTDTNEEGSKIIKTGYKSLAVKQGKTLVEIDLETGRTHQIRAQLAHIGHPLAGDVKYGAKNKEPLKLTAYRLRFDFPADTDVLGYLSGKEFQTKASFAGDFETAKS